uniref:Uncharacterized protein n=1 Tax=Myoviridae sp. ctPoO4 TaxID=2827685 RepID=A0A8S5SND3_9CAUD|nr:MAG TPA: hypothetical protein [Myoviridae sp. ctPoO4]DAK85009.1 MAG TPA: hypothetical protein [Caudoviricetes sp.]
MKKLFIFVQNNKIIDEQWHKKKKFYLKLIRFAKNVILI